MANIPPDTDLKERAVAGILWLGWVRLSAQLLDQAFTIVLVRLLAPADFGLIAMSAVFTRLLYIFANMGLGRAVVQRHEVDDDLLSTAFWGNLVGGVIFCGLGLAASQLVANVYNEPLARPILAAISVRFVMTGANVAQEALLTRELRYSTLALRSAGGVVIGGAVGVALAVTGAGVWSLVGQILATDLARTVLLWVATSWRPRRIFSWSRFRQLWTFGSRILGWHFFNYVVKYFDNFLIGRALGTTLLGYYALGYSMFLSPLIDIYLIVGRVAFSVFSRIQRDRERVRRGFLLTSRYVAFFALPALVGLFLVARDLVTVVFGPKWLPAVPVLHVLLIAGALHSQMSIWSAVFQALDRADWLLRWAFASAVLYVPAFYVGLRWGIVGVAAGYTLATLVLVPFQFHAVGRLLAISLGTYLLRLAPVAVACAAMAGTVLVTQRWLDMQGSPPVVKLLGAVTTGVVSYLLGIAFIQRELITTLMGILGGLRGWRKGGLPGGVAT